MKRIQRVFLEIVTLILLATCYSSGAVAQNTDSYLTKYIAALNARMPPSGDPGTVAELYTSDGVQESVLGKPSESIQRGQSSLREFFAGFKEFFSDWTHIESNRLTQGSRALWEGYAEGHHKESGKRLRFPIVFVLDFDNQGKVRGNRVYFDEHAIDEQLK